MSKWRHLGSGIIVNDAGFEVGRFVGDFKQRDRLICAVNKEQEQERRIEQLEREKAELAKEALNNVLWLERRLPKGYGEVPHIKRFIAKLEGATATEGREG